MSTLPVNSQVGPHRPETRVQDVPRFLVPPSWLYPVREVSIIGLAAFIYFFVCGLIRSRADLAMDNARSLIGLEQRLGIFREGAMQSWITSHEWLVTAVNSIYIYGHWPLIAGTLVWLFAAHRQALPVFRTAMLVSGAIGIIFFVFFPMAPPRFMTEYGFIDTVTLHSEAYRVLQPPSLTNQFAAMPSLHVGWNLLMGIAIVRFSTRWYTKAFGVSMPLAMYLATLFTANHYIVDGIVGSVIALASLTIALRLSAPRAARAAQVASSTSTGQPVARMPRPQPVTADPVSTTILPGGTAPASSCTGQ